jgi:hypothetical protein
MRNRFKIIKQIQGYIFKILCVVIICLIAMFAITVCSPLPLIFGTKPSWDKESQHFLADLFSLDIMTRVILPNMSYKWLRFMWLVSLYHDHRHLGLCELYCYSHFGNIGNFLVEYDKSQHKDDKPGCRFFFEFEKWKNNSIKDCFEV